MTLLASAAAVPLLPREVRADDCDAIETMRNKVVAALDDLEPWALGQGQDAVARLHRELEVLEQHAQAAGAVLEGASAAFVIDAVGGILNVVVALVGFFEAVPIATAMVAGLAVGVGVIIVKGVVAPQQIEPVSTAASTVAADVGRALDAWGDMAGVAHQAANIASFWTLASLAAEFFMLGTSLANREKREAVVQDLRAAGAAVADTLSELEQPGNLVAFRQERLTELAAYLEELHAACVGAQPLPPPG